MEERVHGNTRHGHNLNGKPSPTYRSWYHMKDRCQNSSHPHYKDYGARGIRVCERWQDFANFLADMGERPEDKTLDRIDNNKGYEPGNCRWATKKQQTQNRRVLKTQRLFVATNRQGKVVTSNNQHEFAKQYGLDQRNINACLNDKRKSHRGWKFYYAKDYLAPVVL